MQTVKKAVFPVAGLGTRFLPATKASPKEMLPIVDKPLIQYAVEEAVAAGITDIIFISSRTKRTVEDHFDKAYELETELEMRGKTETLDLVKSIRPPGVNFIYIRQAEALGLGHAVLCARPVVGNEPFAVILADDLLDADTPVMKQMVAQYDYYRCSILGVQHVARAANCSSRMPSPPCSKSSRCWPTRMMRCATTAAASWVTCRPRWITPCGTRRWQRNLPPTSRAGSAEAGRQTPA